MSLQACRADGLNESPGDAESERRDRRVLDGVALGGEVLGQRVADLLVPLVACAGVASAGSRLGSA